jgi:hypothetical protein
MSDLNDPTSAGRAPDPAAPGTPLPPGAGSPVQPGPPMSVNAPISDTTINRSALMLGVVIAVLVLIVVVVILIAVFSRH